MFRIVRADGSSTWQKHHGPRARFFPRHDLAHYAVETELGFRRGFYGLIAEGWDIADTTGKGARGPIPDEAVVVEYLVGWLDAERADAAIWPASRLREDAAVYFTEAGRPGPPPIDDAQLDRVRATRDSLVRRWADTAPGARFELTFDRP